MSIARPLFADGAILAAADLSALEANGRDRDARHARHLHAAGVATGLTVTQSAQTTSSGAAYVDLTLTAGYALREINCRRPRWGAGFPAVLGS